MSWLATIGDLAYSVTTIFNRDLTDVDTIWENLLLTKGRYRLFFDHAENLGTIRLNKLIRHHVDGAEKIIVVDAVGYDSHRKEGYLDVTIKQNSITAMVVFGIVAGVVLTVGALTINSILTHVLELLPEPMKYGILLIFLIPVALPIILPLLKKGKG